MKQIFLLVLLPILMISSCNDQVCEPNKVTTTFSDSTEIQMFYDSNRQELIYRIENGNKLVFQHEYYNGHCEGFNHDDYTVTLAFEVPADATELIAIDSALAEINCFIHHSAAWIQNDYPVTTGTLSGQKLADNEWVIRGSVSYTIPLTFPQVKTIAIDRVFNQ